MQRRRHTTKEKEMNYDKNQMAIDSCAEEAYPYLIKKIKVQPL